MEDNRYCAMQGLQWHTALAMVVELSYGKYNVTPSSLLQKRKLARDTA